MLIQIWQDYFQIEAQKYPNKAFFVPNLRIFNFEPKFAVKQIRGRWFQIWQWHTFQLLDFLNWETKTCFYCVGDTVIPEASPPSLPTHPFPMVGAEVQKIFSSSNTLKRRKSTLKIYFSVSSLNVGPVWSSFKNTILSWIC